ncbi:MAG: sulfatase-like hydrolase/transferase [Planctomycetota bacterium]
MLKQCLGVIVLCIVPLTGWLQARPGSGASVEKPNLIVMMADDLGKEWVSCYGAEEIETPAIDRFAASGLRFQNAYAMPQCTPTRVTLLTGQYPFRHGWINHWDVPRWGRGCHFDAAKNPSVARQLRAAGYATGIVGKWQINDFRLQPDALVKHGFDEYCVWTGAEGGNPPSTERYWNPYLHTKEGSKAYSDRFGPDVCAEFAFEFLKEHKDGPFFLYWPMILPHGPFTTTPAEPDVRRPLDRHAAMIRHVDSLVGRLEAKLEELGLAEKTIVIWTTDNGSPRNIRGKRDGRTVRGGKSETTEPGICVPFLVKGPGVPKGAVTEALTDFSDLLPTLCDLAGAELPKDTVLDGRSIAKVIRGEEELGPREWILAMGGGSATFVTEPEVRVHNRTTYRDRVLRDQRFKLTLDTEGNPASLVDLKNDPAEETNLLGKDDPEAKAALQKLLAVAATFPKEDAHPRYDPLPPQPWDRKFPPADRDD